MSAMSAKVAKPDVKEGASPRDRRAKRRAELAELAELAVDASAKRGHVAASDLEIVENKTERSAGVPAQVADGPEQVAAGDAFGKKLAAMVVAAIARGLTVSPPGELDDSAAFGDGTLRGLWDAISNGSAASHHWQTYVNRAFDVVIDIVGTSSHPSWPSSSPSSSSSSSSSSAAAMSASPAATGTIRTLHLLQHAHWDLGRLPDTAVHEHSSARPVTIGCIAGADVPILGANPQR